MQAMKQFAKEIGAPDATVCDASGEQMSQDLKSFLNKIGTSLRVLEDGTPWANKAELCTGLLKEAVRQDMKEPDSPIPLWHYFLERRARINNLTAKDLFQLHGHILCYKQKRHVIKGHTCVQLFVADKGFVCVIPMKRKGEVLQAMKQFAKEIGAPDAIV